MAYAFKWKNIWYVRYKDESHEWQSKSCGKTLPMDWSAFLSATRKTIPTDSDMEYYWVIDQAEYATDVKYLFSYNFNPSLQGNLAIGI